VYKRQPPRLLMYI